MSVKLRSAQETKTIKTLAYQKAKKKNQRSKNCTRFILSK